MNLEMVEKIANAVLYEGYLLYPYTASAVKNQQRWNFGVLYPPGVGTRAKCRRNAGGGPGCRVGAKVRFLQEGREGTVERQVEFADRGARILASPPRGEIRGAVDARRSRRSLTGLVRVTVRIRNLTGGPSPSRCMLSTHTILTVEHGEFVSLMDPPPRVSRRRGGVPQRRDLAGPGRSRGRART